jgi:gliding motility-associated lipoprotein GldD
MRQKNRISNLTYLLLVVCGFVLVACTSNYTPKPMGYFRINLIEKEYTYTNASVPYTFEYPSNIATIRPHRNNPLWIDVAYPIYNAKIHCSYLPIKGNFYEISEDTRAFVYKHSVKANAITQQVFENDEAKVYGVLYEIKGNVASSLQFTLTDSIQHYFRGAVYFNNRPNNDSIAPVLSYIREDVVRIMETLKWK